MDLTDTFPDLTETYMSKLLRHCLSASFQAISRLYSSVVRYRKATDHFVLGPTLSKTEAAAWQQGRLIRNDGMSPTQ